MMKEYIFNNLNIKRINRELNRLNKILVNIEIRIGIYNEIIENRKKNGLLIDLENKMLIKLGIDKKNIKSKIQDNEYKLRCYKQFENIKINQVLKILKGEMDEYNNLKKLDIFNFLFAMKDNNNEYYIIDIQVHILTEIFKKLKDKELKKFIKIILNRSLEFNNEFFILLFNINEENYNENISKLSEVILNIINSEV